MSEYRGIQIGGYDATPASSFGPPPKLQWLSIKQLVIDPVYQRDIGANGRRNILRIAAAFDWAMFAPVVVAAAGNDRFAIVDGQHRATAAALCGIERVPCAVIEAGRARQAAAFAAINAVVTAMSSLQLHAARLAAGDKHAIELAKVCAAGGVTICRYPVPSNKMVAGQTLAVGMLSKSLAKYGADVMGQALRCITKTRKGYPGLIRQELIEALCAVLEAEPAWSDDEDRLLKAIWRLDLATALAAAHRASEGKRRAAVTELVDAIAAHLDKELGEQAA